MRCVIMKMSREIPLIWRICDSKLKKPLVEAEFDVRLRSVFLKTSGFGVNFVTQWCNLVIVTHKFGM